MNSSNTDIMALDQCYLRGEYGGYEGNLPGDAGNSKPTTINKTVILEVNSPLSMKAYWRFYSSSAWTSGLFTYYAANLLDPYTT